MRKAFVAVAATAVVCAGAVPPATAAGEDTPRAPGAVPLKITGGTTEFGLTEGAEKALTAEGVRLEAVAPAKPLPTGKGVSVSVANGSVTPTPFDGSLTYGQGGFRFIDDDGRKVEFADGRADLKSGTATATVNGDAKWRVPLGSYRIDPTKVKADSATKLTITGVAIKMTPESAMAVNMTFGKRIFEAGDAVFDYRSSLTTSAPVAGGTP